MSRHLFLSVRPEFTEKILTRVKTTEFRRTKPRVRVGQPVIIYASSPTMAIVGTARVRSVTTGSPTALWRQFRHVGGIGRDRLREYFRGAELGHAICLECVAPLESAMTLREIRSALPGFQPPQAFIYLSTCQVASLGLLAGSEAIRS